MSKIGGRKNRANGGQTARAATVSTQKSGNEVKINNTVNELKTYLNPIQKRLFSQSLPEDNENLMDDEVDYIETIASNYYEVIKFVLKRMRVKKFDEIRFSLKNNYLLVSIVKKGKEFYLDFNAYVHHNDEQEQNILWKLKPYMPVVLHLTGIV